MRRRRCKMADEWLKVARNGFRETEKQSKWAKRATEAHLENDDESVVIRRKRRKEKILYCWLRADVEEEEQQMMKRRRPLSKQN